MAKTQGDGEDERWLAGLRGESSGHDGAQPRRSLAPDPWLDGPFPARGEGQPEQSGDESEAASDAQESSDADAAAVPDPWGGSSQSWADADSAAASDSAAEQAEQGQWQSHQAPPPAPMPAYRPEPSGAPMPQVPPASEPMAIPRLADPWTPQQHETQAGSAEYEIPRLAAQHPPRADDARTPTSPPQDEHPHPAPQHPAPQQPVQQQPVEQQPVQQHPAPQQPVQHQPVEQQPVQHQPAQQFGQPQQGFAQYGSTPPAHPNSGQLGQPGQVHPGYGQGGGFGQPVVPTSGAFAAPQHDPHGGSAPFGGPPTQPPSVVPLDLSDSALVRQRKAEPDSGWRKAVYRASFGGINPGISREQLEKNALIERIRTPIRGCHKIAVVSLKGGIGKTTTTSCLGLTLAHYRGDRVVALDANPDAGTLAERLTGVTDVSVRDMLDNLESIDSFTDISRFMSLASRLQVLASDQDAEVSEAFDSRQYKLITSLLSRYYNVILTDSGTGMLHSAMQGTLEEANSLVVVGAPSVDGSSRAAKTLDWLVAHGHGDLVASSVAVISSVREKSDAVDMDVLRNHFGARCRAVIEIPYDPHLVIGGRIDMAQIRPQTEHAYLELGATVADGFSQRS